MESTLMNTQPEAWVEPNDPGEAKAPPHRITGPIVGLLALLGAVLAFYFLFFHGGLLLAIGFLFELIALLGPPQGEGVGSLLMLPAAMVTSGLCLAFGLLDIAYRGLTRKPFPGWSTLLRFFLISLTLVVATMISVGVWTRTIGG
jgi:hypothetical protein